MGHSPSYRDKECAHLKFHRRGQRDQKHEWSTNVCGRPLQELPKNYVCACVFS